MELRSGPACGSPAVTVLILTRDEADNLRKLLPQVLEVMAESGLPYELLVIDAGSKDGSAQVAGMLGARVSLQKQPGYGNALREGIESSRGDFLLTLDADLSHRPEFVEEMIALRHEADIIIASRYVAGGTADMPFVRRVLSGVLNTVFSGVLGIVVRDVSSGFRLYRREILSKFTTHGDHFDVLPEIVSLATAQGAKVREIPFHYSARESGVSKARALAFAPSYFRTLLRCRRVLAARGLLSRKRIRAG